MPIEYKKKKAINVTIKLFDSIYRYISEIRPQKRENHFENTKNQDEHKGGYIYIIKKCEWRECKMTWLFKYSIHHR